MLSCAMPSASAASVLHCMAIVCPSGTLQEHADPMTPCCTGQVKDDRWRAGPSGARSRGRRGEQRLRRTRTATSTSTSGRPRALDEEEDDLQPRRRAGGRARHAAKRGVRSSIAAAVAAAAADNSDSDYRPPGRGAGDGTPRRSLRSGRGRAAQAFSGPAKVRACTRLK